MGVHRFWLAMLACAFVASLVCAPMAQGATYTLRPTADVTLGQWAALPAPPGYAAIDDAVTQPATPSWSEYLESSGAGGTGAEFHIGNQALGAGEVVTQTRAWANVGTGPNKTIRIELVHGTTVLGAVSIPGGSAYGWRQVSSTVALTQAQVNDLRMRFVGSGASSGHVGAGYVELTTAFPPPAPTITGRPGAAGRDKTPEWTFTADAGLGTECQLVRGTTTIMGWGPCVSPRTFDLAMQPDGTYTFSVRSKNASGVLSAPVSDVYRLDTSAPAPPTITSAPPAITGDDAPTWSFVGEPGATFTCELRRDGAVVQPAAACTSPRGYDLSAQPDGDYVFSVIATDAAGNPSLPTTSAVTIDRDVPGSPSIALVPSSPGSDLTPSFSFSAAGAASYECRWLKDGVEQHTWIGCGTGTYDPDLTFETDGVFLLEVRGLNAAAAPGPESSRVYELDTTDPSIPLIADTTPLASSNASPQWSFTGDSGSSYTCEVREGARLVVAINDCTSPVSADLSAEPDAVYTFSVIAFDAAGNESDPATRQYTLDRTVPPAPSIDAAPATPGTTRSVGWSFSGSGAAGFECRLEDPSGAELETWTACASPRAYVIPDGGDDGAYRFSVRGESATGVDGSAATSTYVLDTTKPAPPDITDSPVTPTADDTPSWSFTAEDDATTTCRLSQGSTVVSDWSGCSSPENFDLSTVADGSYLFEVRAADAAQNVGDPASRTLVLDRSVPPQPTIVNAPPADGDALSASWEFTGTAPAHECRLVNPAGTPVEDWTSCTAGVTKTYDLTLAGGDGRYDFEVRGISATLVRGPEAAGFYRLDTSDPAAPTIDSGPSTPSADDTPTWAFTGEPGARLRCRVERDGGPVVVAERFCTSPETFALGGELDGTFVFYVKALDAAGNEGPEADAEYTLDRAQPPAPQIDASPGARGSARDVQWAFSGPGASFECRLDGGAWTGCVSPRPHSFPGDATYTFEVRAISATGVPGHIASSTYLLDTTAPGAPVITSRPGATGNAAQPLWGFTVAGDADAWCRLERDGAAVADWARCDTPKGYDLSGEPDGAYDFLVRGRDAGGLDGPTAGDRYVLDRSAPPPPAIQSGPGPVGAGRSPAWTFAGDGAASYECRLERAGGVALADWGPCASPRAWDLAGAGDGEHTFLVRALDAAGNRSGDARAVYTLDTTPGALRIDSGPPPLGRDRAPAWAFSAEPGATVECRLDRGGIEVVAWSACTSPRTFDLTGAPDGSYRFAARAFDPVGNLGAEAAAVYELDTTSPGAPVINAEPKTPGDDRTPTWRFSGEPGARFACRIDRGGVASLDWSPCTSPFTGDLAKESQGTHRFRVRATDAAGNTGTPARDEYVLDVPESKPKQDPPKEAPKPEPAPTVGDGPADQQPAAADPEPAVAPPAARPTPQATPRKRPRPARRPAPRRPSNERAKGPARERDIAPAAPAENERPKKRKSNPVAAGLSEAGRVVANVVTQHPDKSVFPGGLIFLVFGFLAVQNRIDRSDPKLALAPVHADPDLEFPPPPEPRTP